VTISGGSTGGHTIQDEGSNRTARTNLNFVGDGVTVTDSSGTNSTVVTIPGAAGGAGSTIMAAQDPSGDWWTFDVDNDGILVTENIGATPPTGGDIVISTVPMTQSPDGDWWVQTTDNTGRITTTNVGAVPTTGTPPFASLADLTKVALGESVIAYGATGDGTTDDTAAIQAAISAVGATGGGVLLFPPGLYRVGKLTLVSNVRLVGTAYDHTYNARGSRLSLIAGTNDHMFYIPWNTQNITFEHLHLEGNNASQTGVSWGIYFQRDPAGTGPQSYQQSLVFHCSVKGFESGGIYVGRWNEAVNISECFIANNLGHGVQLETSDCMVSQCHVLFNGGDGVRIGNQSCIVANCPSISDNLRGIAIQSGGVDTSEFSQTTFVSWHQILGNHIDRSLQEGIFIQGLHCLVEGNLLGGNSQQTNGTWANIGIDGRLSDNTAFSRGHSIIGNQFVNRGFTNKPNYHINMLNYSGTSTGDVVESGNSFDLTTNSTTTNQAVGDFSKFKGRAIGQQAAGHYVVEQIGTTTIAAGAGAGTAPPAPTLTAGTDGKGQINAGTGTTPAAGTLATVTFIQPYRAGAPMVVLTPLNAATAALQAYTNSTTTTFSVLLASAPAASQAAGTYQWAYHVIG
jgi:hypothetical protein